MNLSTSLDFLELPVGAFWDCLNNDPPNQYEYHTLLVRYYQQNLPLEISPLLPL